MHFGSIDGNHMHRASGTGTGRRPVNRGNQVAKIRARPPSTTESSFSRIGKIDIFKNAPNPTRGPDLNMASSAIRSPVAHKLSLAVTFTTLSHDLVLARSIPEAHGPARKGPGR